jgi:hypothetical protein
MHANWTSECGCLIVNMAHDARLLRCQLGDGLVVVASWCCLSMVLLLATPCPMCTATRRGYRTCYSQPSS